MLIVVSYLKGKTVLITGGTGSIGQTITKRVLLDGASLVKIFSNDENGQYDMEMEFSQDKRLVFIIGDIRDEERVNYIVKGVDVIFHAAALKHVDRCEYNPFEAIAVNILGTKNVILAALTEKVKKVISISTDKAVNPVSVMGGTKLLAEKMISAETFLQNSTTIFSSVRFGNVLNTRGSIIPRIEKQIMNGGPITLTDKRMKRFFMSQEDAVNLIISAAEIAQGGETFVLKMPLILLDDLFESLKQLLAPKYGFDAAQIKTKIIGMKSGEKLMEELLTDFEMDRVLETKDFYIIPPQLDTLTKSSYPGTKKSQNIRGQFKDMKPLERSQVLKLLKKIY